MAQDFLALRDIVVQHGDKTVLEIPGLDIAKGEVVCLLGPNGAGKTTLLKVIGLLHVPDTGTIRLGGSQLNPASSLDARRRVAMVFQEPLLLNGTVYQNAALGLKLRGVDDQTIRHRLAPWLERLGIASLAGRAVRTLSGGEAQRTSLARALVLEPEVLLLDEPFSALDPTSREALLLDFQEIVRENGITTIIVTHDREEAFMLGDRIGVLIGGRLLQIGQRDEVFSRPVSEPVAEIVGIENRWPGVVENCRDNCSVINVNGARVCAAGKTQVGSTVLVCLRADCIELQTYNNTVNAKNHIEGVIVHLASGMTHHRLTIDCRALRLIAQTTRLTADGVEFSKMHQVTACFDPTALHLIHC
jgi:ABC-type Fe3+/spermidine/putrescine transport system ATPase subunit